MKKISSVIAFLVIVSLTTAQAHASWFSDLTGINIDPWKGQFQIGTPQPGQALQRLPDTIRRLPQDVANLGNPAGLAMAAAVRQGETQASYGAQPMPADVYADLSRYFDPGFLQGVRYNLFGNVGISLGPAVMMLNNDVAAITLNDVIVFRNAADAENRVLWAHELTHVLQYHNMGIDTFANVYTTNAWILENQATDNQNRIGQSLAQANMGGAPQASTAYFNVGGQIVFADVNGLLYPANPYNGQVVGPANGHIVFQNGQYIAVDSFGHGFLAVLMR